MQMSHKTAQVSQERDSQANPQQQKQAEELSNARTHDADPLAKITSRIGDNASVAKHVSIIQRTALFHPMNERQKVQSLSRLQQVYGNWFVQRVIAQYTAQTKSQVNQSSGVYEQEADRVADAVMRMPTPQIQRQSEDEEEEEQLQTKPLSDKIISLVQRRHRRCHRHPLQRSTGNARPRVRDDREAQTRAGAKEWIVSVRPRESGDPGPKNWMPACAGMSGFVAWERCNGRPARLPRAQSGHPRRGHRRARRTSRQ